jgi:hypothetical protein
VLKILGYLVRENEINQWKISMLRAGPGGGGPLENGKKCGLMGIESNWHVICWDTYHFKENFE